MADINQILSTAPADQTAKANAWELFQSSDDQASFTKQLGALNLPSNTKAQIWELKFGGAQPAPGANNPPMSPELQAAYARGQHAPVAPGQEPSTLESLATGVAKGSAETISTVGQFLNKHLGVPMPDEVLHPELAGGTQASNTAENVGKFGEAIGEFVLGDEAVKGMALGERIGLVQKVTKLAESHPWAAKALVVGMDALRQGTVSGAQTLAKGGTPTEAAENAGIVGATSGVLGAVSAGAGAVYKSIVAKSPEAIAAVKQAAEDEGSRLAQQIAGGKLGSQLEVAQNVASNIAEAHDAMQSEYAQGLAQIGQNAADIRVSLAGSPLQKTARDLLTNSDIPAEIQTAMKGVVPDAARLEPLLNQFASAGPADNYSWAEMEATRQAIGQTIRKLPVDSPLRPDLIQLRGGIDSTMQQAAEQSGNSDVSQQMQNLRSTYATKIKAFDTAAITNLAGKNPNAVADVLMNKQSIFGVNTLRSVIGPENMKPVEGSILQKLVDNASTSDTGFDSKTFVGSFNRLGPDVQKAIWGDNLPAVKDFLATAAKVPSVSPAWGGIARYLEHRAIFDTVLAGGMILSGGLGDEYTSHHLLSTGAILAGVLMLHNAAAIKGASTLMQLGAKAIIPAVAGATVEENASPAPAEPAEEPQIPQAAAPSGATIGDQLLAKRAAFVSAPRQNNPALPFHPGAGVPR